MSKEDRLKDESIILCHHCLRKPDKIREYVEGSKVENMTPNMNLLDRRIPRKGIVMQ